MAYISVFIIWGGGLGFRELLCRRVVKGSAAHNHNSLLCTVLCFFECMVLWNMYYIWM